MLIAVFLPIVCHLAALGPYSVQPGAVDTYARSGSGEAVLLPGHGFPRRCAYIRQRETCQHRVADCTHVEVLLLGGES